MAGVWCGPKGPIDFLETNGFSVKPRERDRPFTQGGRAAQLHPTSFEGVPTMSGKLIQADFWEGALLEVV